MKRFLSLLVLCSVVFVACQESPQTATQSVPLTPAIDPRKDAQLLFQVDSLLPRVDSLVLVYFDDPFGPDSLRYPRFYSQYSLTQKDSIQSFIQPMNEAVKAVEVKRDCRIEGKIWCYGSGKMIQTIYWSSHPSGCRFQYLIRDGLFYYFSLTDQQLSSLNQWKKQASKPSATSVTQ